MPRLSKIGAAALAAFGWTGLQSVTASYLVVAGGGGGGGQYGGGGGAGGYRTGTESLNPTLSYSVTVGGGGSGVAGADGTKGSDSVFSTITSTGGGYGGNNSAGSGGSGGGGGCASTQNNGASGNTPSTSPSQGNNGGNSGAYSNGFVAGGGGGAGAVGQTAPSNTQAGAGGAGTASSISGSSVTYAGGGGGGGLSGTGTAGAGGAGGGGAGATGTAGTAGTANLGAGGGGGGSTNPGRIGGNGGSGIVIISYPAPQQFGGGVVTTSGSNVIHTFNTSGTLSPLSSLTASYLIVAGGGGAGGQETTYGGGGWHGGGGGAGGLLSGSSLTIDTNSNYLVTVGSGGAGGTSSASPANGTSGSNSAFSMVTTTAVGGGGGGKGGGSGSGTAGLSGGSGGGGGSGLSAGAAGGSGTSGQGNAGGTSVANSFAGGGGGAGGAGGSPTRGTGSSSSISGSSVTYAVGGLGQWLAGNTAGTANSGNGGDNATTVNSNSLAGGSGVVIISYAGSTQQMAGGTVTITGGNVIHTFTSSGYLTPIKLVNNSLRFRSSASAYLNRTPANSATSGQKYTISFWVKRGTLGVQQKLWGTPSNYEFADFLSSDALRISNPSGTPYWTTNQVFRDPAAWYHLVMAFDTTQATASNRLRAYVNGVEITSWASNSTITQNSTSARWGVSGYANYIGQSNSADYSDVYMAEFNYVDGQQLAPTSFGTINSYGVWQPITYGGSYGTNGFYLPFTNTTSTTTLGYDFSPQGNNWTTNNISLTAGVTYDSMTDVPTLTSATAANYPVLNPLLSAGGTTANGNLQVTTTVGVGHSRPTMAIPASGKWYCEFTAVSAATSSDYIFGIVGIDTPEASYGYNQTPSYSYSAFGEKIVNGSFTASFYSTFTNGDIIGCAVNLDGNEINWYKNGTLAGSATSIANGSYFWMISDASGSRQVTAAFNAGQRPFSYTPPSGFIALNTFNM